MFKKYNEEEQFGKPTAGFGFTVFIAISVFLHIVFIAFTFLLANDRSTIKITTPVYTVDLLAPERLMAPPEANAFKEQKPQTEVEFKKDVSRPAVKEKAIALKKEKEPSLDEAIKKIQKRVEKRESEETISKAIQGMENRQVEKRIKEIKEKVAHRQIIARPIKAETKDAGSIQKGGAVKRIEELEGKYAQLVGGLIGEQWNYMGDVKKEEVIVISVRIDKNGRLVESHIEQSSGNAALVQSAIKAIKKAASLFPPLPNELGKDFVEIGYIFQREKDN